MGKHVSFWIGQGMFFMGSGLSVGVLECFRKRRSKTLSGCLTPMTIAFLYLSFGFSALGGVRARLTQHLEETYPWLDKVDLAFAIASFTAALGNLMLPCFHVVLEEEEFDVEKPLKKSTADTIKEPQYGSK